MNGSKNATLFLVLTLALGIAHAQGEQRIEAAFTASAMSGVVPLTIEFDAGDSSGRDLVYEWTFGDGTKASGVRTDHTYEHPGTYYALLKVSDTQGSSVVYQKIVVAPSREFGPSPYVEDYDDVEQRRANTVWHVRKFVAEMGAGKLLEIVDPIDILGIDDVTSDRLWVSYEKRQVRETGMPVQLPIGHYITNLETGETISIGLRLGGLPVINGLYIADDANLAAFSPNFSDLYVMDTATQEPYLLFTPENEYYDVLLVTFKPDNSEIAFSLEFTGGFQGGEDDPPPVIVARPSYVLRVRTDQRSATLEDAVIVYEADTYRGGVRIEQLVWDGDDVLVLTNENEVGSVARSDAER